LRDAASSLTPEYYHRSCVAVFECVPPVTGVTLEPEIQQMAASDAKTTEFPDAPPDAVSVTGPPFKGASGGAQRCTG